jgi:23S rRNA-/tRNA-specific pseudouridylate synthase
MADTPLPRPRPRKSYIHEKLTRTAVNRLDRLTSGLMILALSSKASRDLANEFQNKGVKKEYVARVRGCFPEYVCIRVADCGLGRVAAIEKRIPEKIARVVEGVRI